MGDLVLADATANALLDALDGEINTGTGTAILRLHVGVEGTDPAAVPAGATLQDFNLANPAFGASVVSGSPPSEVATITLQTETPQAITASGVCGSFSILNRNGAQVLKGDAGTTGTMLTLQSTTIAGPGADLTESSCTITLPLNLTV